MMKSICLFFAICFSCFYSFAQEEALKEKALQEFNNEHYSEAINLLEEALKENPNDAEIYYYLGRFNHYRIYDSRTLAGVNYANSEKIFQYLDKAIELNPNYGDAKYFYGAECGGNAFLAMQNRDSDKLKYFYELAYRKGAYPDWLIEFGKNFLDSCDKDAILFTAGDADLNICSYLQFCENYRTDVTVVPLGSLERPWYVQFLKDGLPGSVRKININLTPNQIMDLHPAKWKETEIAIDVSPADISKFNLPRDYKMNWSVLPDLQSERMHANLDTATPQKRTLLSPQRTILLQILEDNLSQRPIYFSNFAEQSFYGGLKEYFQNCGLISRLTPIKTADSNFEFDREKMENLLSSANIVKCKDLKSTDIPRISKVPMYGYWNTVLNLADIYKKDGDIEGIKRLKKLYDENLKIGLNTKYEEGVSKQLEQKIK